jgi:hypothetical protein
MKHLSILLFVICIASITVNIRQYYDNKNTDPLTAYISKYVVDLPEQLNGSNSLTNTYLVARLQGDTVYVYFAPYNGYQLRLNRTKMCGHHHCVWTLNNYTLMDNDREVGTFKDNTLDSIVVNDNQ